MGTLHHRAADFAHRPDNSVGKLCSSKATQKKTEKKTRAHANLFLYALASPLIERVDYC
jgi:hypothetical protein